MRYQTQAICQPHSPDGLEVSMGDIFQPGFGYGDGLSNQGAMGTLKFKDTEDIETRALAYKWGPVDWEAL